MRVLVVVGTRPEAVKLAPVVLALRQRAASVMLCATGQHPDLVPSTLAVFDLRADRSLPSLAGCRSLSTQTAEILRGLDDLLAGEPFGTLLVQGDTTSALGGALAGFYRGIPVGHVEAGLRTHDLAAPFPEEGNRSLIGRIASHHFAPTPIARANLLREGVQDSRILVTGNTVVDAIDAVRRRWTDGFPPPSDLIRGDGRPFCLVTLHRRENTGERLDALCAAIRLAATRHNDHRFVFPLHPNPLLRTRIEALLGGCPGLELVPPLGYRETLAALAEARLVVTDSGGLQEEAPSFGVPVLVLRDRTERPEGIESGHNRLVGTDPAAIGPAIAKALGEPRPAKAANPFGDGCAAERIADRILGHAGPAHGR